jgi:hypothetical protein
MRLEVHSQRDIVLIGVFPLQLAPCTLRLATYPFRKEAGLTDIGTDTLFSTQWVMTEHHPRTMTI